MCDDLSSLLSARIRCSWMMQLWAAFVWNMICHRIQINKNNWTTIYKKLSRVITVQIEINRFTIEVQAECNTFIFKVVHYLNVLWLWTINSDKNVFSKCCFVYLTLQFALRYMHQFVQCHYAPLSIWLFCIFLFS